MTKTQMLERALETHIRSLEKAVDYGLGTQPDDRVEARWEADKHELAAYQYLKSGQTGRAKTYMLIAKRLREESK